MKLKEKLAQQKFIITFEIRSPIYGNQEQLLQNLQSFQGNLAHQPDGIVGDTIKTCKAIEASDLPAIYQTAIRGKNRLQIQNDLIGAADAGIENLLVFTEDYRIAGDSI